MSIQFLDSEWMSYFKEAMQKTCNEVRWIAPFIQWKPISDILGSSKIRVRLITRYNIGDFWKGVSDLGALEQLLERGAEIRGVKGLHSKVYLFDSHHAFVTSANLTNSGLERNREYGLLGIDDLVAHVSAYFEDLWSHAGPTLTPRQLNVFKADLLNNESSRKADDVLPDHGAVIGQSDRITATHGFVKFFGSGNNRADRSMPIAEEIERSGCHWACTYPRNKRPRSVETGALMYFGRFVHSPNDILVYGRGVGRRYVEERDDALAAEIRLRRWKRDWPHYIRVNDPVYVRGALSDGISLNKLMEELGSNAFSSTQRHANAGSGNTNPRRAYSQQAAVELTVEALAWIDARFTSRLATRGRLSTTDLWHLDWPTGIPGRSL